MLSCKIPVTLLAQAKADLHRSHPFAYERVGYFLAGLAHGSRGPLILVRDYMPVADEDYVPDPNVGAMMGPGAIRKAQERALFGGDAIFHVHSHGGRGLPGYSDVDLAEYPKFLPDFLKVARQRLHGAIVLSNDQAIGLVWRHGRAPETIHRFVTVGEHLKFWSAQ